MKLQVVSTSGKSTELEIAQQVFGEKPNMSLIAQAVRVYLFNQRQGNAKVKTRSDVARTKKKWYKQKGTGGARHGARTPSIFVGGGVAHGPAGMTDWTLKLSAAQRRKAMVYALSVQCKDMIVSRDVEQLSGKTKDAAKLFNTIAPESKHILVILHEPMQDVIRSSANLENVLVTQANRLNIYETLLADKIIMTEKALRMIEEKFASESKTAKVEKPKQEAQVEAPKKAVKAVKPEVKKAPAKAVKTKIVQTKTKKAEK